METNSGDIIGKILGENGVSFVFTLCGGHISPILTGAKKQGIRIIDVRHEANAVFAADASARLTGTPGIAAVTAGPGVTNSLTALKNAQMAQSPVILLAGAAPTVLKNKGALQDIDQLALVKSITKMAVAVKRNCDLVPVLEKAFDICRSGVPGPVFIELPIDILYAESLVRQWYGVETGTEQKDDARSRLLGYYLKHHVDQMFACEFEEMTPGEYKLKSPNLNAALVSKAADLIASSEKPLLIIGSQGMLHPQKVERLSDAVGSLGIPTYLTGMARGLLGKSHPLLMRHQRRAALKEADLVLIAGMPCDFRLNYGRSFGKRTAIITVNRSKEDLRLNCKPKLAALSDPFLFLCALAETFGTLPFSWESWSQKLCDRDEHRDAQIQESSHSETNGINPLHLLRKLNDHLNEDSILIADGGDFVASASYILQPRSPMAWMDPGVFGTLGVGAGFALGAKLIRPNNNVWLLYGDGAAGFSLPEFDTFVRHRVPIIAVVGNDAAWSQIARDQIAYLGDDVATVLRRSDYHLVAEGFGAEGFLLEKEEDIDDVLRAARQAADEGRPVLINAMIGKTDFRDGSISM